MEQKKTHYFLGTLVAGLTVGVLILGRTNFSLAYILIEFIKSFMALGIVIIASNTYPQVRISLVTMLGIVCGVAGIFNFIHIVAIKGLEFGAGYSLGIDSTFWIAYRLSFIFLLLLTLGVLTRKVQKSSFISLCLILVFALLGISFIIFYMTVVHSRGSDFYKTFEVVLFFAVIATVFYLLKYRRLFEGSVFPYLSAALASITVASPFFMAYLFSEWKGYILLGSSSYLWATYFLYNTVVAELRIHGPRAVLHQRLEQVNQKLEDKNRELTSYNKRLIEEEAINHAFLANVGESIIILDRNGIIEEFNPAAESMFGYLASEVKGIRGDLLLPSGVMDRDQPDLENETYKRQNQDLIGIRKDGSSFLLDFTKSSFKDSNEKEHFIVVLRDISKRRENDKALILWGKVFETSVFAVTVTDVIGNIQAVNRGFTETTGYEGNEVLGENPRILKSGRHGAEFYRKMWTDLNDKGYWEGEIWNKRKNGEIYPEWLTIRAARDNKGQVINYIAFFRDITQDTQLRKEVNAAGKIQRHSLRADRETPDYILKGIFQPFNYVSGDFYDYRWDEKRRILHGFLLDIMGHGLATALQISAIRVLYRYALEKDTRVEGMVEWINKESIPYFVDGTFGAAICFSMDFEKHNIEISSAGINNVLYLSDGKAKLIKIPGLFLGLVDNERYDQHHFPLQSGDCWFFISDGFSDILSEEYLAQMTSFEQTLEILNRLIAEKKVEDDATALALYLK